MSIALTIYAVDLLSKINAACIFGLLSTIIVGGLVLLIGQSEEWYDFQKIVKWSSILTAIFAFGVLAIPSQKTIYTIIAAHYGQEVMQTDDAIEIGEKILGVIKKKLDE